MSEEEWRPWHLFAKKAGTNDKKDADAKSKKEAEEEAKKEVGPGLCKHGCGRKVAPGQDGAGRPLAYCCRGCATGGAHSANCLEEYPVPAGYCKVGCGRPVARGVTRSGKPFESCCRGCLLGFGHDAHCVPTKEERTARFLYFGNPGSGKSTLANCLAGEVLFRAGAGHGEGLTVNMSVGEAKGRQHVDLPGISDARNRPAAAREATKALREGGWSKIIVVFVEQHCRLRAEDRTTLKLILQAAPEIGKNYGVVVNQCGRAMMKRVGDMPWRRQFESILLQDVPNPTDCILYLPRIEKLDGAEDTIYEFGDSLMKFAEEVPSVFLTPEKVSEVSPDDYEALERRLRLMGIPDEEKIKLIEERLQKEAFEQQQRNDEEYKQAIHNRQAILIASLVVSIMAVCCYQLGLLKHRRRVTTFGRPVDIDVLPSCLLVVYMCYRVYACVSTWFALARGENEHFNVFGRKFAITMGQFVAVWHVWIVAELIDACTDFSSLCILIQHRGVSWISVLWGVATVASTCTPIAYLLNAICQDTAVLFGLVEDLIQMFVGAFWEVFERSDDEVVPSALLFSCVFAILGCIERTGDVKRRLRSRSDAELSYTRILGSSA